MRPSIEPGEDLRIACGDPVSVGDVAVLVSGGRVIVHRVVAREKGWLITRGDAGALPDVPVPAEAVVGRVAGVRRSGEFRELEPAPDSVTRRAARSACVLALRVSPGAASFLARCLWALRRFLVAYPAAARRRLTGSASDGQEEA